MDVQPKVGKTRKRVKRGSPWSQFLLLSTRYLELLKNDRGTLFILLLQAPVIAIILVLTIRSQLGTGVFDANNVVRCRTQILTSSGPLTLPQAQTTERIDCNTVLTFLKNDAHAQAFVHKRGSQEQALQDFIQLGSGGSTQTVLFVMAFTAVLFGCINSAREIVKEDPIYKRERSVNLGILPYMFSKIAVLGLLCLFQSAVLVFIMNLGEPLRQGIFLNPLLETYITLALVSLAGLMIGLAISAIAPNNDRAMSFVPIVLIPQLTLSGTMVPIKNWFSQIMAIFFPTRWAMAALGSSIGLHSDKIEGDKLFGDDSTFHGTLFSVFSKTDALHRLLLSWISLGAIIVVLTIVVGVFLKLKDVRT
jgi:ABC transport system ATP-binding/permease protein